ncbi:MAG TPA: malto-oligosyltrehalose synthase [Gaiellaceae bacterium]
MELRATYRLQLGPGLGFRGARELVPYLRDLGISHLYLSPVLEARAGSTHGYDVVDPRIVSEELGGEEELRRLCDAGLGVVLDVVPNHMAAVDENPFWSDPALRERFFDLDPETGRHRRFFDIDELAGVRVEDPDVFESTHAKVLQLVRQGLVDGLRIDHPDGLADPEGYLGRLRERAVDHVWVEKILEPGEELRPWPVAGTTGYEFANDVTALFVDPAGEEPLTELFREVTGERRSFAEVAREAKLEQVRTTFGPEVERLRRLWDASGLEEALAALDVYRSYVVPGRAEVGDADRAAAAALPEEIRRAILLEERGGPKVDEFVVRFQQTTGPVTAKGVEDTALYRWPRLLALNEVGGDPDRFSLSVEDFYGANLARGERHPEQLLATQTHDTKRSGDVRARIGALAGLADEWAVRVNRWEELTEDLLGLGGRAPDATERYLLWQTLVGAWPIEPERLSTYVEKALREAKRNTAWVNGDPEWEAAALGFCSGLYRHEAFRADFEPFAERVARAGEHAGLGQTLLKLTSPGVPDVYQGDELWSLSLVDPDNRRQVDWARRRRLLGDVRSGTAATRETAKLHLVARVLGLRAERPEAFAAPYLPVDAGPKVCSFLRGDALCVVVPLDEGSGPKRPPDRCSWQDLLPDLPVGLYVRM